MGFQLLARGQKTIHVMEPNRRVKEVPITPELCLGAPPELARECVRQRRIWIADVFAIAGGWTFAAQDKFTVKVPNGLAFSEFKGYEAWQVVSISHK